MCSSLVSLVWVICWFGSSSEKEAPSVTHQHWFIPTQCLLANNLTAYISRNEYLCHSAISSSHLSTSTNGIWTSKSQRAGDTRERGQTRPCPKYPVCECTCTHACARSAPHSERKVGPEAYHGSSAPCQPPETLCMRIPSASLTALAMCTLSQASSTVRLYAKRRVPREMCARST